MKLSVVMPAHNEAESIGETIGAIVERLEPEAIEYELLVVDDNSTDETGDVVRAMSATNPAIVCIRSPYENGFGLAVRAGLERYSGGCVAIMMADNSDSPDDLVTYYRLIEQGYDCAFGSRWIPGSKVSAYPRFKLILNRIANTAINFAFGLHYNDTSNAFKMYRRETINSVQPLMSKHFNLTVELPLKSVIRGSSYAVCPISWRDRTAGESKLALEEMGSRYLFIVLYAFLERHLTRGDYRRTDLGEHAGRKPGAGNEPPLARGPLSRRRSALHRRPSARRRQSSKG